MPRISTQEKYSIETWLGLVGITVVLYDRYIMSDISINYIGKL